MALFLKLLWDYRKALAWASAAVAFAVITWRVMVWRDAYERLGDVQAELSAERSCAFNTECQKRQEALEAAQRETTAKVVGTYEAELAGLRNRPPRVVRVCPDPNRVQGARSAGATDGAGPATGVVSGQAGRDIGRDLYDLAREADEVSARLRALQQWNQALSQ